MMIPADYNMYIMYSLGAFSQLQVPELVDRRISWEFPGTPLCLVIASAWFPFQNLCRRIQSRELDSLLVIKDGVLENPAFIYSHVVRWFSQLSTSIYIGFLSLPRLTGGYSHIPLHIPLCHHLCWLNPNFSLFISHSITILVKIWLKHNF